MLFKVICVQIFSKLSYDLLSGVPAIERFVLGGNVNWDRKMASALGGVSYKVPAT